jgi:general secretion pathway protein K
MALMLVVWFIAGLSVLVAAGVSVSRSDSRLAQLHIAKARVAAAGDGAIQLALAKTIVTKGRSDSTVIKIGELDVGVNLVPISRLVNINRAPLGVLSPMFQLAAGDGKSSPDELARAVIEWRNRAPSSGGGVFYSIEDLLRVEGITRTVLDQLQDFVVVGLWAGGGGDWRKPPAFLRNTSASPDQMRRIVAGEGDDSRSNASSNNRETALSSVYRADAVINFGNVNWIRRRWVRMAGNPASNLPWRFVRTEAPRVIAGG